MQNQIISVVFLLIHRQNHPEYVNTPSKKMHSSSSSSGKSAGDRSPNRPQTALQFFYKEKLEEYKSKHPNVRTWFYYLITSFQFFGKSKLTLLSVYRKMIDL